jgi:5'-methylthioadenosine phosphorylase
MSAQIGIIGGSGLYDMEELTDREEVKLSTPFGEPSGPYVMATLRGRRVAFLARHGAGHKIMPSELNFRANIFGFKLLGVERIFSASAVGSFKEEYPPLSVVIPDQFFDRTQRRISTFFGRGIVVHVSFAHPVCPDLSRIAFESARTVGAHVGRRAHMGGTYVCIEGPQFSTLAESKLYKSWGMDVVGMTNLQEAKLAREAELCYATMALVTDYDVWYEGEEDVTLEQVLANVHRNVEMARAIVRRVVTELDDERDCACRHAVEHAITTPAELIPQATRDKLDLLIGKYLR